MALSKKEKQEMDEFFGWTEEEKKLIDKLDSRAKLTDEELEKLDALDERNFEKICNKNKVKSG